MKRFLSLAYPSFFRTPNADEPFYPNLIIWILLLGFGIRLFASIFIGIINPDGPFYIYQAKAIYYGQWDQLTSCNMHFLSAYPIFIASAYTILQDWITAARSVSLFFGTLTLVFIYLFLRRFFERHVSALGTLVFALIPVFVTRSGDVVRGPVAWFFMISGLYFFVLHFDNRKHVPLVLSSLCYLIAAWARIEVILFLGVSVLYILFLEREKKFVKLLSFIAPPLLLLLLSFVGLKFLNTSLGDLFRADDMLSKFSGPIHGYKAIRASLAELMNQPVIGPFEMFVEKARHLVWFIALATLCVYVIKAFFYPYFIIFALGLPGLGAKIRGDRRIVYLMLLCVFSLALLYVHLLQTWTIGSRFLALFMLPASVILGFGLEKIFGFLRSRFRWNARAAFVLLCLFILAFGLAKNLKPRERNKVVFKNIGQFIAEREGGIEPIPIATSSHILYWVSFYAHLNYRGKDCPQQYFDLRDMIGNRYEDFLENLRRGGFRYFIWEERHWPAGAFDFTKEMKGEDFQALGNWYHPDTGRMILFKIT